MSCDEFNIEAISSVFQSLCLYGRTENPDENFNSHFWHILESVFAGGSVV